MKNHQLIFDKVKELLKSRFLDKLIEYEEGGYITIEDSEFWISSDEHELTVGYGLVHNHYNPKYDDIEEAVERIFNLLTSRIMRTDFFKGEFPFKHRLEIEFANGIYENIGTGMTWLFPYWKRTTKKVTFQEKLINTEEIKTEIEEIRKLCTIKVIHHADNQ